MSHKKYNSHVNALFLNNHFFALPRHEAVDNGLMFYFHYLLYDYSKYQTQEELYNSILIWISDDVIINKRHFIDALLMFTDDLNYNAFENVTTFINSKKREPSLREQLTGIPFKISNIKSNKIKRISPKIIDEKTPIKVNDKELQIIFLEWLSERLIDKYKGDKLSEKENRDEVRKWIENKLNKFKEDKSPKTNTETKLKAPVIASFCSLVNSSKLIEKNLEESVAPYCQRICKEFDLKYKDRVRQNFNTSDTKKNIQMVKLLILPALAPEKAKKINDYLDNKDKPKPK